MKYFTFKRSGNDFTDILKDSSLKKVIDTKITWDQHLIIGIQDNDTNQSTFSYITIKYGDDLASDTIKDLSPVPGVDYMPKKDKNKFKQR